MACKNASLHKCLSSVDVYEQKVTSVTPSLRVPATPPIFWPGSNPVLSTLSTFIFSKEVRVILQIEYQQNKIRHLGQFKGDIRSYQTSQIHIYKDSQTLSGQSTITILILLFIISDVSKHCRT